MYEIVLDYHCELIRVSCCDWKSVRVTIDKAKRKWPGIFVVGILNKTYMDNEKLEIRFSGGKKCF